MIECDAATVPPDADAAKAQLRSQVLAERVERAGAATADRPARAHALAGLVLDLPEVTAARTVGAYLSIGSEPPTTDLVAGLRSRGVRVMVPVVLPDRDLDWAEYDEPALIVAGLHRSVHPSGALLGPAAVSQADVLVVPALAVDRAGHRLGRGGGSYDRALDRARPDTVVVALIFEGELLDLVPTAPHDRPVHVAVTPSGVHRLRTLPGPGGPLDG